MPRGRSKGSMNRTPGIHGQTISKVRNEDGSIDRSRLSLSIDFADAKGNRLTKVFEVRMSKDGNSVYIPTTSETLLVSEAPPEPEAETSD